MSTKKITRLGDRFWSKVNAQDGCWLWKAATNHAGYGIFSLGGSTRRSGLAHRILWEEVVGPIPGGCDLHHKCENPACVNPDHLEPLTRKQHRERHPSYQLQKTHCPQGHPYSEENTYRYPDGRRKCRLCCRNQMRAKRALAK